MYHVQHFAVPSSSVRPYANYTSSKPMTFIKQISVVLGNKLMEVMASIISGAELKTWLVIRHKSLAFNV